MRKILTAFIIIAALPPLQGQISVQANATVTQLMNSLVGQGISFSNVQLTCPTGAYGTFSNGNTTNLGITDGIILTTGGAALIAGPNNSGSVGLCNGTSASDAQLTAISPQATYDYCKLEFDFVPQCTQLSFRFVYGSEEYPEFVNSAYTDAFGIFLSGPGPSCQAGYYSNTNLATVPGNTTPVTINTINATTNSAYYVNNTGGTTIQYDGFTTVLTKTVSVCACQTYHVKLAIADAGDCNYDSGLMIDFEKCNSVFAVTPTSTPAFCNACSGTGTVWVSGTGPFTYSWTPGGYTTYSVNALCPGTYSVTVNDGLSCTPAIITQVVIANTPCHSQEELAEQPAADVLPQAPAAAEPRINASSVFSPGGDGLPGRFSISGPALAAAPYELQVYNTLGMLLYATPNPEDGWAGTDVRGQMLPPGIYIWRLLPQGGKSAQVFSGTVLLLDH